VTISIQILTADDLDAADAVLMAAYSSASRKRELARYLALQPDGWRLATLDGVLAGVGGAIDYGAFGYIGLVGVDPAMQRCGVALGLMEHLLAWLRERGTAVALLDASPAGYPLYERMGFTVDDTVTFFTRRSPAPPHETFHTDGQEAHAAPDGLQAAVAVPGPFMAGSVINANLYNQTRYDQTRTIVQPARRDDLPALVAFDAPRFGADRSALLLTYLDECEGRAFVAHGEAGRITGFLFAPRLLGPWMAATPEVAEALLVAALALPWHGPVSVQAPAANAHGEPLLGRYGFAPDRTLRHMRLGGRPQPARRTQMYGQASFALG
jgi:GNAT superfamily N-acetyltransferase